MRPSAALGAPPAASAHDPRRWLRLVLYAVAGAAALAAMQAAGLLPSPLALAVGGPGAGVAP